MFASPLFVSRFVVKGREISFYEMTGFFRKSRDSHFRDIIRKCKRGSEVVEGKLRVDLREGTTFSLWYVGK